MNREEKGRSLSIQEQSKGYTWKPDWVSLDVRSKNRIALSGVHAVLSHALPAWGSTFQHLREQLKEPTLTESVVSV